MKKRLDDYILEEEVEADLERVRPDKNQVRQHFTKKELESLGASISDKGQIEPGLAELRRLKRGDYFDLICGHRRYWSTLLARQRGWTDKKTMILTVTEPLPKDLRLKIQIDEKGN